MSDVVEIEGTYETAISLYVTDAIGTEIGSFGPNDMDDDLYGELIKKHGQIFGYYIGGTADGCEAW